MFYRGLVCGTLLLALAACSGPDAPATETPRAVKLERFGAGSDSPLQVPALVRQEQRAELAFEGAGRLSAVLVDVGDRVTRGRCWRAWTMNRCGCANSRPTHMCARRWRSLTNGNCNCANNR